MAKKYVPAKPGKETKDEILLGIERLEMYNNLENGYRDWLHFCFENPEMDIFEISDAVAQYGTKKKEAIAFTALLALFEKAYLTLENYPPLLEEWTCWDNCMKVYAKRPNFKSFYTTQKQQVDAIEKATGCRLSFDPDFEAYMNKLVGV